MRYNSDNNYSHADTRAKIDSVRAMLDLVAQRRGKRGADIVLTAVAEDMADDLPAILAWAEAGLKADAAEQRRPSGIVERTTDIFEKIPERGEISMRDLNRRVCHRFSREAVGAIVNGLAAEGFVCVRETIPAHGGTRSILVSRGKRKPTVCND